MDVKDLAVSMSALIAPFAPYLVEGGTKFAGKAGEAAWEQVQRVWRLVTSHKGVADQVFPAATLLANDQQSHAYRAALTEALTVALQKDKSFEADLRKLLDAEPRLQELIATRGGVIENASQEMKQSGTQRQRAEGGTIKNPRQKM